MPGSYYSDVERTIYLTYVILVEDIAKYDELFQQERKFLSFEYWSAHVSQIDYDDLVYGLDRLSEIVSKQPDAKDGLVRFLYEIILRRMEVRDRSRSVNSIDVIFNFDCIGFTGTPFIDNYPTFVSGPRLRLAAGAMGPSPTGPSRIGVPALPARATRQRFPASCRYASPHRPTARSNCFPERGSGRQGRLFRLDPTSTSRGGAKRT